MFKIYLETCPRIFLYETAKVNILPDGKYTQNPWEAILIAIGDNVTMRYGDFAMTAYWDAFASLASGLAHARETRYTNANIYG